MTTMYPEDILEAPHESAVARSSRSILFVIDQLTELGGAERMMFELARQLSRQGYRITMITFRDSPSPEAYTLADELIILPLRSCFSLRAISVAWKMRSIIRERKITLAQTYFESADLFGALICKLSGIRHICSSRRDMGLLRTTKHALLYRLCTPLYSRVLAVSQRVAHWHQQQDSVRPERMQVIYNGVRLEAYDRPINRQQVRRMLGIPENGPLVTTISNINPWKGLDIFLEAAALVHGEYPDTVFAIAGDWTDLEHYNHLCRRMDALGLSACVFFLGRVKEIPSLLLASDVFALLSRTEGFPNVVIEAMAARIPVVATDVGGTSEAVIDGATGYLVPNEDYSQAAARISTLLSDPEQRNRIATSARQRVEKEFSIDQMTKKHTEVYDALLSA